MAEQARDNEVEVTGEMLRSFLAGRDVPCPSCQYNLRDLQGLVCPECGEKIILRVSLAEPKQGLLIAGLVGLSAGAGLNGLLLIYMVIQLVFGRWGPDGGVINRFLGINAVGLLIEGSAMAVWLVQWRRIRRARFSVRLFLVTLCWVLTLIDIVVFSVYLR